MNKRIIFSVFALLLLSEYTSAQLKVTSDGKVAVATTTPLSLAKLTVGSNSFNNSLYNMGTYSHIDGFHSTVGVGVYGYGHNTLKPSPCLSIGVMGVGASSAGGTEYGVLGLISGSMNGAGVLGTKSPRGWNVPGRYAGFFYGDTYVDGSLTTDEVITPSDMNLKENVSLLSDRKGDVLDNIMNMNVITYNYKYISPSESEGLPGIEDNKELSLGLKEAETDARKRAAQKHFGLSAQELQTIYPELVRKGQDGNLGVNYIELVPILIRSIQELKAELDEVKGKDDAMRRASSNAMEVASIATSDAILEKAKLFQNTPNPFSSQTQIHFTLPDDAKSAYIYIFDMTGKMQKQIAVNSSMESVTINGYELSAGIYLYSLVVNGQEVDTKRMILSK
ncbi:tail fiber domain-containing protein [Xylanibacter brevis]|uniref:tail fiber domain-containing protein n=1 Tax=Xylanibacter brevis TaxID=83231 RepID=UPI0009E02372|nr:tail fiber domain-containing protein [Xylanibacter brevis]